MKKQMNPVVEKSPANPSTAHGDFEELNRLCFTISMESAAAPPPCLLLVMNLCLLRLGFDLPSFKSMESQKQESDSYSSCLMESSCDFLFKLPG